MDTIGMRNDTPQCFESDYQYVKWLEAEFVSNGGKNLLSVCVDCTVEYAERMRAQGRCEHPERNFDKSGNPAFDSTTGASGYRGVSWHKDQQKWIAKKSFGGVQIHLGYFDDPREASEAWEEATTRGPAYYGITDGVVSEDAQRKGLLVRDNGAQHKTRKDSVQKRPVWILRHSGSEGVRHIGCSNYQPGKLERKSEEDNGA